jgi:hypothetical protein
MCDSEYNVLDAEPIPHQVDPVRFKAHELAGRSHWNFTSVVTDLGDGSNWRSRLKAGGVSFKGDYASIP